MAASTTTPFQIPQHVTALLSHLTSRPGVQSTFILSRKDGSIIQSTGLIASKPAPNSVSPSSSSQGGPPTEEQPVPDSHPAGLTSPTSPSAAVAADPSSPSSLPTATATPTSPPTQSAPATTTPYQPSHAEALAAHVFAFVASATDLSLSLSRPPGAENTPTGSRAAESGISASGAHEGGLNGVSAGAGREDGEGGEGSERDDDDEVKLLRMRTKKHEIVVVPDRKYLLCVVHDVAGAGGAGGSTGGGAMGGAGGRGR